MRTLIGLLIVVALVNAANAFNLFKKKTTPNPAVYCKDKDEDYCKGVKNGTCETGDKDRCAKSCNACCFDMYPEECKKMEKEGFCSFALGHYTEAEIKVLCGVTCGLCKK